VVGVGISNRPERLEYLIQLHLHFADPKRIYVLESISVFLSDVVANTT
jgi:hypothetical protein